MAKGLWVQVAVDFLRHPKLKRCARMLAEDEFTTAGRLFALWAWALEYFPDGIITEDIDEIASVMKWEGDVQVLLLALTQCGKTKDSSGFIDCPVDDDYYHLHGWAEYSGELNAQRTHWKEKKRRQRESNGTNEGQVGDIVGTSRGKGAGQPLIESLIFTDQNCKNKYDVEFDVLWSKYPRKKGKETARKSFCKHRKNRVPYEEILQGLEGYLKEIRANSIDMAFIMYGSTFFGPDLHWQDYLPSNNNSKAIAGGMMDPTSTQDFAAEKKQIKEVFGGDATEYAKWLAAGKPEPASDWLKGRQCSKHAGYPSGVASKAVGAAGDIETAIFDVPGVQ